MSAPKRLMIVLQDAGPDGISIDLIGDTERLSDGTPIESLTLAEYWGMVFAKSCVAALETGSQFQEFQNMKVESGLQ